MRGNILVVDDDAGPRESLRQILKTDHDVRTADSGPAALECIAQDPPDLVLLDLRMPGMDGTELMQRIKEQYPEVEVAVVTAYAGVDSARMAVRLGALDYLTKPYSVDDVKRLVDRALAIQRRRRDAKVLAAQVHLLSEALGSSGVGKATEASGPIAAALDSLRSVQKTFDEDVESVHELYRLGEATAEVTHDVSNLLTVILTSAQALAAEIKSGNSLTTETATARADRIIAAARTCTDMVQNIKQYVRPAILRSDVDANALVAAIVEMMRDRTSAAGQPVEFVTRLRPLPLMHADTVSLKAAIVNLVENSLNAIDGEGTIELRTSAVGDEIIIEIEDNGRGMPPEVMAQATEPFFSHTTSGGTGLGLSIVEKAVRSHSGRLSIDSVEGKGTVVTLRLPVNPDEACSRPETTPQVETRPGRTVLVVEDEETLRDLIVAILQTEGYDVVPAADGQEAWELFQELRSRPLPPHLVIVTDQEMPRLLGRDLARRVKEMDPQTPVVLISAYVSETTGPEDCVIPKPFGLPDFLGCIRSFMPPLQA